jgi:hypothetical protein
LVVYTNLEMTGRVSKTDYNIYRLKYRGKDLNETQRLA